LKVYVKIAISPPYSSSEILSPDVSRSVSTLADTLTLSPPYSSSEILSPDVSRSVSTLADTLTLSPPYSSGEILSPDLSRSVSTLADTLTLSPPYSYSSGEILSPDVSRREFVISCLSGMATIPMLRLSGNTESNWNPNLIRPPGALAEKDFLARCIKCGQCMRICPTNVIHPSGISARLESLWTPALNFRIGTSGCQRNCIACGYICPTAAIRPIPLDERLGINQYEVFGPIKIGTAFVDQGRCLPWSMDKPCIVCQENCPVSPKAILTREYFSIVQFVNSSQQVKTANQSLIVKKSEPLYIEFESSELSPDHFSTGDYFCKIQEQKDNQPRLIVSNNINSLNISPAIPFDPVPAPGTKTEILIRLQRPYVDPNRCIGCGVCEHECPVRGKRAIRITAENESRNKEHALIL